MKTVFSCPRREDAIVATSLLESVGIPVELMSGGKLDMNPLFNIELAGFTVVVPDQFEEDALAVIRDYRSSDSRPARETDAGPALPAQTGRAEPPSGGQALMALATASLPQAIAHRRALHAMPEVGNELPRTKAYVRDALGRLGLHALDCGPGLVCDIGSDGPLIAIRADMDALPISEETGASYQSALPVAMHACGHDAHTAALLAVAGMLASSPPRGWRARLLFQPGEEGEFGARLMIEAGCLDGVGAIVGAHLGHLSEELEPGQAGFMAGPMMAASDRFEGAFIGSGGHGSAPHQALDPIPALAQFILAVQTFRNRRPDQRKPLVMSVCQVQAGSAFNIIPGEASFKGTVRSLAAEERDLARQGLLAACQGAAIACGLEYRFDWLDGYPALYNDPASTEAAMAAARSVLGDGAVKRMAVPSMGGEDFAYYLQRVPGCFWFLNTQNPAGGIAFPNHHPRFDLDERLLDRLIAVNLAAAEALARSLGA